MQKSIYLKEEKIMYSVRASSRAKHVRIAVGCDGAVLITQPIGISLEKIEKIILNKAAWILNKINFFKKYVVRQKSFIHEYKKYREEALSLVRSRIRHFNDFYQFTFNRISLRNQKTRWGSCSRRGNLNFNYRIIYLSPELADYIIVHELCHLAELNHSKNFWKLVEKKIPNYSELRYMLKQNKLQNHEEF